MSELNQLIGFLEEQLTVSEPTPDYTRHNQEIITYIEYLKSIKQPQLNESQQIVLDWLKTLPLFPISAVYLLEAGKNVPNNVKNAYENFDKKEETEVLQAFSQWAIEQEEK
ncbi:TPA: hypothetical protein IUX81_002144 [Enterococcus faecalis]|nr:hypothetical protein [Enterococcus faecalis]